MKRKFFKLIIFILFIFSLSYCASLSELQRREYGLLESAVSFASDKIIGEYGDSIPDDFSPDKFMEFLQGRIPKDYFDILKKYTLEIKPKKTYYLLLVFDPKSKEMILFDYSCTPEVDGPILLEPEKYDINRLDLYDKCK